MKLKRIVTAVLLVAMVLSLMSAAVVAAETETVPMYRLYNPNSGEHFYTGSVKERDDLVAVGWNYEGIGWNAPVSSGAPVYRVFNPNSGDHHYTMSQEEIDMLVGLGWQYEGVCWNSPSTGSPQYRLYNPNADLGSHHYTSSVEERENLVSLGWIFEGIGWYGAVSEGHTHSYQETVTVPTCTEQGYTTYTCACGDSYKGNETAALGHKWGNWCQVEDSSTGEVLYEERFCQRDGCGKTETRAVEKLPAETEPDEPTVEDYLNDSHYADEAITYINEYRAANKLPALKVDHSDFVLLRAAELRVSFSHTRPNGGDNIWKADGWASECIGAGYGSAKSVVDAWYNSTGGHKETMLNASYTVACVAYNGVFWVLLVA